MLKITFLLLASTTRCRSSTRYDATRNRTTTRARENEERGEDSSKRENRNNKRFSPFSIDVSFRRDTRPDGAQRVITKEELRVYRREGERKKKGRESRVFYPEGSTRLRNGAIRIAVYLFTRLPRFNKHIAKLYDYERSRKRPAPCTDHLYFQLDPRWWIGRPLSLLIDGMPTGEEEVGGWDRGGTGPHGNYF